MSAERVRAWVADHAKDFEVPAQRRDADNPMVDRALELVRAFIVERGLILFGGLAIDYALRLRGAQLYPDDERPDFDVLSPRSVDDAYDLVDRLAAAGFAAARRPERRRPPRSRREQPRQYFLLPEHRHPDRAPFRGAR